LCIQTEFYSCFGAYIIAEKGLLGSDQTISPHAIPEFYPQYVLSLEPLPPEEIYEKGDKNKEEFGSERHKRLC